jgi:hypothetical protein
MEIRVLKWGKSMLNLLNSWLELWCNVMHRKTMWPIHGQYRCAECMRVLPVEWASQNSRTPVIAVGRVRTYQNTLETASRA